MNTKPLSLGVALASLLAGSALAQSGGNFAITESTIDGGGLTHSAGGSFSLAGTVGQPDAGAQTGGGYTLEGGFWHSVILVQLPTGSQLKIKIVGGPRVVISWPVSEAGWTLQSNPNLSGGDWTTVASTVVDTATEHTVTLPANGNQFFRLHKQL